MAFEDDYKKLRALAEMLVSKNELPVEPDDLINDAYIELVGNGNEYSFLAIKALIFKGNDVEKKELTRRWELPKTTNRRCKKCNQAKPTSAFPYRNKELLILDDICKECTRELDKIYRETNKEAINLRQRDRYLFQTDEQKAIISKRTRDWHKQQSRELTDAYLRQYLRSRYGFTNSYIGKNPHLVDKAREYLTGRRKDFWIKKVKALKKSKLPPKPKKEKKIHVKREKKVVVPKPIVNYLEIFRNAEREYVQATSEKINPVAFKAKKEMIEFFIKKLSEVA